jgi:hypothetical protein
MAMRITIEKQSGVERENCKMQATVYYHFSKVEIATIDKMHNT